MRYSVIGAGKRVRPLLVYAAGTMFDADLEDLDLVALAVECVHSYSLIHDDMPCMDNDTFRHGKHTTHVEFGEALAMLAGDALQPEAFLLLGKTKLSAERKIKLVELLAEASSTAGMCGGQAIDLLAAGGSMSLEELKQMHRMKTGALLLGSILMGAYSGKTEPTEQQLSALTKYGRAIGLAFQIVDDILDVTQSSELLGKTAGKDEAENKPTYVSVLGLEKAREMASEQHSIAMQALEELKGLPSVETMAKLADFIVKRNY